MKKLIALSFILILFLSCKQHTKEVFYFNDDLDFFVIVYGVECGELLKKNSKDEWEYHIPKDGILLLKNEREEGGIINMESYMNIEGNYELHCKISPYEEDFGEPRGTTMKSGFSPRTGYTCGETNEKLKFTVFVYIVSDSEGIDERIDSLIENTLFGSITD
jgi:hypothetical protein